MRLRRVTRSPVAYWLAVIVLAAATALFVFRLVDATETLRARFGTRRPVAVAVDEVGVGHVLTGDDVVVREVPTTFVPAGAATSAGAVVGRTVVVALFAGEAVLESHLAPAGVHGLGAHLTPGRRAMAVPVGAAAPAVRAGDAVDVLATLEGEKTFAVAEGATVLAVGADAVTVALSIDETSGVADAIARGAVTLAVRSPVENPSR
ncbi:MAG: Flp pilus assembly protein CpaB [Actinobacteria bacterium]|nr:MAG: Flp pilus assembly protein CpaB [Actinomycetota bacterium]